ncbi:hypothetical protein [Chryseosolibacter indicus]|uniref:Uncharacterized protein n=1 Tax=Chryseosolibacter indicus TaxID=2782351 RepID=A0ABS5VUL5_9BACT|nr:hypothetical protein [Chryseosolibacter indicus]MBT1704512.1 hypothetical protein [Chryseosolibacter indicus]
MEVFDKLSFKTKGTILKRYADYVTVISFFNYKVKLYSWDGFFIEEYYNIEERKVTRISAVTERDLQKYIKKVSLNELGFN